MRACRCGCCVFIGPLTASTPSVPAATEYKDGGSGRSVSFTDMLLRVRGTSSKEDPSRLLVGVLEVKGQWQFKLPDGMTLEQGLEDDKQSASVIQVVQQVGST